jgi:hypothetical protein
LNPTFHTSDHRLIVVKCFVLVSGEVVDGMGGVAEGGGMLCVLQVSFSSLLLCLNWLCGNFFWKLFCVRVKSRHALYSLLLLASRGPKLETGGC